MVTTTPRSGNNANLGDDATPLGARSATTTPHLGDNANLGDNATPLGAQLATTTPHSSNNANLGNNAMLSNILVLGDGATRGGVAAKHCNNTLGDDV